ncbi:MAG: hypothetical protein A2172_03515 [Candidatus Woykebacteria bacterium RBG_13_40_15]|uniref:Uncharacterized protein n=1 Tax=Candidatus Woykebacteria bacterium RBG_13_40_15 TaxID=1802593 RepID=A0A1G1W5T1_9BACT|nr:MAG: hypothetical protein A2172_03515 [Candidatus Woykebacteria bacterium RBG_13_40_15]
MTSSSGKEAVRLDPESQMWLTITALGEKGSLIVPVFLMGRKVTQFPKEVYEGIRGFHRVISRRTRYFSVNDGDSRLAAPLRNRDLWEALRGMNSAHGVVFALAKGSERDGQASFEAVALYLRDIS